MARVVKTRQATLDMDEIWIYIALRNEVAADGLIREIQRKCQSTADYPFSGRARPELGHQIRSFPVGNYIVYYVPIEDGIEVRRVYHAAREIDEDFEV